LILSRESGPELLNAVAHAIIKDHILPRLKDKVKSGKPGAAELVKMYEDYTGTGARAEIFGAQAFKAIESTVARYGLGPDKLDDFIQELVEDIYQRQTWKSFTTIEKGFESFAAWFTDAARNRARNESRELTVRNRMVHMEPTEEGEGDPLENVPGRPSDPMEALVSEEVRRDLREFIRRTFKKPAYVELLDAWLEAIDRYGSGLNIREHVLPAIADQTGLDEGTLYGYIKQMRAPMAQFFKREYNLRVPIAASDLRLTDRLVYTEYRRRMAGWVLSGNPVLRIIMGAR
jgi:hypothetical protein